jgi:predicted restriction endonuclease
MAFNQRVKRLIVRDKKSQEYLPCVMCGKTYPLPDAVHIIDAKEWKGELEQDSTINGVPLCPNCHRIFDEILRPYLYRALQKFGCKNLPKSWSKSNKITVTDKNLDISPIRGKAPLQKNQRKRKKRQ